jgi:hypothetical protein
LARPRRTAWLHFESVSSGRRRHRRDRPGLYHFPRLGRRRRRIRASLESARSVYRVSNFQLPPPRQKYLWATQATRCSASRRIPRPGFHRGKRRRQRFARTGISPAGCGAVALTQFWGFCGRQDGPEANGGYLHLLTALLAGVGWLATTGNFKQTMTIGIGPAAALLRAALWLGSLRSRPPEPPSHRAGV